MTPAFVRKAWSGLWCAGLVLVVSTACSAAMAQVLAGDVGAQVLSYADFGRADILMSAAAIRQSDGSGSVARISQELDISSTDPLLNPSGHGNIADISQSGSGNRAVLSQRGDLNRARIVQNGSDNLVDASQAGVDNRLDVTQTGINNSLVARQNGNGNSLTLTQEGGNVANLTETGDNNTITVRQVEGGPSVSINVVGSGYSITIRQ